MGDAMGYIKEVKEEFKDTPEKYHQFLGVIEAFKAQKSVPLVRKTSDINKYFVITNSKS